MTDIYGTFLADFVLKLKQNHLQHFKYVGFFSVCFTAKLAFGSSWAQILNFSQHFVCAVL